MHAAVFVLYRTILTPDPVYEAYVANAGIDGSTDFDIVDNYSCGAPPCGSWTFPQAAYTPSPLPFSTDPAATVPGPAADPSSIYNQFS
ncbi:hypothetical protein GUITHDRAFT_113091 [Guillardia theta CCMP2712]|uniref:Uncharacterized protein n=1 Tax=Guillardia theta (strain CCMP2712) TaxID=905079 RepID=L1IYD5_GUITC|nr:hypothetical protein GUITHDRAFT_113091 [Guillardia theta CCMP2712]EKX40825.1 hypothetical protein GUITHDRAFT_113091 [Guillardia theta CCMP2712]|eukprot:XP_005827805.1 hypothetical protein GUITHDRAFT_113091 [Guillardia theta CCMP2712]